MSPKLVAVAIVALAAAVLPACSEAEPTRAAPAPAEAAAATELRFDVRGMHCDGCANTINATIAKMDGVLECSARYETEERSSAVVKVADTSMKQAVADAIESLGYEIIDGSADESSGS